MDFEGFRNSLSGDLPPTGLDVAVQALWWDAKGDWAKAHGLVDELETEDAMAVHAYLHRKDGEQWNADYWYRRSTRKFFRTDLAKEWAALAQGLLED